MKGENAPAWNAGALPALNVSICLAEISTPFCPTNFPYSPKSRHNAAEPTFNFYDLSIAMDLIGASGSVSQTSCAQGQR